MFVEHKATIAKVATAVAVMLAAAVALIGFFIVFIDTPAPHALLATLAATIIIAGLMTGKLRIAWYGLAFLFAYSVLFLFSAGAALLPLDFILLILLTIIQLTKSKH